MTIKPYVEPLRLNVGNGPQPFKVTILTVLVSLLLSLENFQKKIPEREPLRDRRRHKLEVIILLTITTEPVTIAT